MEFAQSFKNLCADNKGERDENKMGAKISLYTVWNRIEDIEPSACVDQSQTVFTFIHKQCLISSTISV